MQHTRRQFLVRAAGGMTVALTPLAATAQQASPVEVATIQEGNIRAVLRDNSQSPKVLSGLDSLLNLQDAPQFDAFDPDTAGASAGLNFEHIISGHKNPNNSFTPRRGRFELFVVKDGKSCRLVRKREDDPWSMSSTLEYTAVAPHYIDVDFRCVPHDRQIFGQRGYAILFFANYMNDVREVGLHFRGIPAPNEPETWIVADAPPGHADWVKGGTYRSSSAADVQYDGDHEFRLNSWSYDYPRFTRPFYFGRAANDMVLILMFNKIYTDVDEIRFSLFKFKLARYPRPAWDFQYVLRRMEQGQEYGFKARLVWKKFVSPEDCQREYETWRPA